MHAVKCRLGTVPRQATPQLASAGEFLNALRDPGRSLRDQFKEDPEALADRLGLKLPEKPVRTMIRLGVITEGEARERFGSDALEKGLRDLVIDVCTLEVRSAVAVANRGGGKSQGVSFIEFFLFSVLDFDALNLGGSELQADQVYQYLQSYYESDPYWKTILKGEPMRERTESQFHAWIRVLTASQKSVRSPHAGGKKKDGRYHGGLLVIDEEAEAAPEIVAAALPTINTARPSVNVRCSTFHNAEGSFKEVVDNHAEMGYELYQWNIFDVAERCDCTGGVCQSGEKCFREDHKEPYEDPETGEIKERLVHKAYCGGRAQYADGWIPMPEIETMWKRMKRNHSTWEVEAMGSRPANTGHVIKDRTKFARSVVDRSGMSLYMPGAPVSICVDWGTVAAGVGAWQNQFNRHALLWAEVLYDAGETETIGKLTQLINLFRRDVVEIAADVGGGGNYLNKKLREEYGWPVRDVKFAEEKEAAVAAWNVFNESEQLIISSEHTDFIQQVGDWKRKLGRIKKGNDHLCDMSICYFSKFIEELGLQHIRIVPRTTGGREDVPVNAPIRSMRTSVGTGGRVPVVRTLGGRR